MRKLTILAAGAAVALAASTAQAQITVTNDGLSLWYDNRATVAEINAPTVPHTNGTSVEVATGGKSPQVLVRDIIAGNAGGAGDGAVLFVSPRMPNNPLLSDGMNQRGLHWVGSKNAKGQFVNLANRSLASLHRYATVESVGGAGEVIGALGTDIVVSKTAATGNRLESVGYVADANFWDGNAGDFVQAGDTWTAESKAVQVPVAAGPVYDNGGGLVPTGAYHIGRIDVAADVWQKGVPQANGVYTVQETVNNLLIVRVFDGPAPGGYAGELPDFGYTTVLVSGGGGVGSVWESASGNGIPEPGNGSGSDVGTTSTEADAVIWVQALGDYTNDGNIDGADTGLFLAAATADFNGAIRQRERWLGDLNNDSAVDGADTGLLLNIATITFGSDCSVPANCP